MKRPTRDWLMCCIKVDGRRWLVSKSKSVISFEYGTGLFFLQIFYCYLQGKTINYLSIC